MARKKAQVIEFRESRSIEQLLIEENKRLKGQLAQVMRENAIMRKQLSQPETGPIWPNWIDKHSVRKLDGKEYLYEGLNNYGDPMLMHRTGKWYRLSHVVYEQNYGSVPEGHNVYHHDGDKYNNHPDNLIAMTAEDYLKNIYDE